MGLEDEQAIGLQFADDEDHFIYCPEGQTVTVEILAEFRDGATCNNCNHSARDWVFDVFGAENHNIVSETVESTTQRLATIELGDAGDEITIKCTVGDTEPGDCDEDKQGNVGEHTESHLGTFASCTIKLWRLDLEADADPHPTFDSSFYKSVFADNVTTTADVVGSVGAEYRWQSWIGGGMHLEVTTPAWTWSGKFVAQPTTISCRAQVLNQCDPGSGWEYATEYITVDPDIRREGWTTEVQLAGTDDDWLSGDPLAFPQVDWSTQADGTRPDYGRLANDRAPYDKNFNAVVVPIYGDLTKYAADYASFTSRITEITSGPNEGLFYNSDPTMYEIRRKALTNYWINPAAGHPSTPAMDNNGNPYTNWLSVYEAKFGADCPCLNPAVHGGTGTGAWFRATKWHENAGSPASPNKRLLGHFSRLEDYYATHPRSLIDPIYRIDLLYDYDEDGLRAQDEGQRLAVSNDLLLAIGALHGYVGFDPQKHNFTGDLIVYEPGNGWQTYFKRF